MHTSIFANHKNKSIVEIIAHIIFVVCALVAVMAVFAITAYMIINGSPALFKVGIREILFNTKWAPAAAEPHFGILYVILTSIVGTFAAILLGVPVALLTAVFLAEVAPKKLADIVRPAVTLLAGIPSVIYGLLGILILNPLMYKLEKAVFAGSSTHQYTGGSNMLSAILVLAIMILPTVINPCSTGSLKKCFSCTGRIQDRNNIQGSDTCSKIRYYFCHCSRRGKSDRRSYGDHPRFRQQRQCTASV